MNRNLKKISVTVPPDLLADLDYVAARLSISRSSLISTLMSEPLHTMRELLVDVPIDPTPEDVIRFRGASAVLVRDKIDSLKGMADDLFTR